MQKIFLLFALIVHQTGLHAQTPGCTDPLANNYNSAATQNDGSCAYNPASTGVLQSWNLPPALEESSGLLIWNGLLWTHNDDADIHLYALDTSDIPNFQAYPLTGTANTDWEEIAQDDTFLYIGDFGNNAGGNRTDLHILRVEKASLLAGQPLIDTIWFSYSLQTDLSDAGPNNTDFDCEAFIVAEDSIYLFTKEWVSRKSSVYVLPKAPGTHVAQFQAVHDVQGLITGAAWLEDKRLIALCGYSPLLQPFLFLLYDFPGRDFFAGNKRKINVTLPFHQVEGIATADGLSYFLSNERFSQSLVTTEQKLQRLDLSGFLGAYLQSVTSVAAPVPAPVLRVYPNPVSGELTIEYPGNSRPLRFDVLHANGQALYKGVLLEKATVQAGSFPPGLHLIRLENGKTLEFHKVVKR